VFLLFDCSVCFLLYNSVAVFVYFYMCLICLLRFLFGCSWFWFLGLGFVWLLFCGYGVVFVVFCLLFSGFAFVL